MGKIDPEYYDYIILHKRKWNNDKEVLVSPDENNETINKTILKTLTGNGVQYNIVEVNERKTKPSKKNNYMNIFTLNIGHIENKLGELNIFTNKLLPEILLLQETHTEKKIFIPNYSCYEQPKSNNSHGLAIAIRKNIETIVTMQYNENNLQVLDIYTGKQKPRLINIYCSHDNEQRKVTLNELDKHINKDRIFIAGD